MTTILRYDVRIPVRSPFLFESLDTSGLGLDSPAMRNRDGRAVIPGDHVRGHLSHAIRAICASDPSRADLRNELFGVESDKRRPGGEVQDLPCRGRIDVGDFLAKHVYQKSDGDNAGLGMLPKAGTLASVRVEIDDGSGAASEGSLQFIELVAPPGGIVTFEGTIRIRAEVNRADEFEVLLNDALRLIPAMGGSKSIGFGALVTDKIFIERKIDSRSTITRPVAVDRLEVSVSFDRPILVDAWANASNLFRGSTIVPGAAIKGAIATLLADERDGILVGSDGAALSKIHISHAFPIVSSREGDVLGDRAVPLSLAATTDESGGVHFADTVDPAAIERLLALSYSGVSYPGDWKGETWSAIRKTLRRPDANLSRSARGRVGISSEGLAETGKLFVVAPVETRGRRWRFVIDRCEVDRDFFGRVLDLLAAGLPGIGRTGARLEVVEWAASGVPASVSSAYSDTYDTHAVVLETGAMLTDPTSPLSFPDQYAAAFRALAGSSAIELVTHFAQRRTIGGYLAHRYRRMKGRYVTSELTLPGSVFVLKGPGVAELVARATRHGLGAVHFPDGIATIVTDWRVSPFVPENGWGEITVTKVSCETISCPDDAAEGA